MWKRVQVIVLLVIGIIGVAFLMWIMDWRKPIVKEVDGSRPPSPARTSDTAPSKPLLSQVGTLSSRTWKNSIGATMVRIEPGEFTMGAATEYESDAPPHKVAITRAFSLGAYEVTQGQYQTVTGTNPSLYEGSDDLPVEQVSWLDAIMFCNKLSEREGRKPFYRIEGEEVVVSFGDGYRLPTEAEWEYASRAGSTTRYPFGEDKADLGDYAWVLGNARSKSHPVGQKRPNQWGLYDMLGNIKEWCHDRYDGDYYRKSPAADPMGSSTGSFPIVRGGDFFSDPANCRPTVRAGDPLKGRINTIGFRIAATRVE